MAALLRVLLFAIAVPTLFRLRLPRLNRLLAAPGPPVDPPPGASVKAEQIIRCVELARAVGNPLVRPRCLTRAVTLFYFLRRAGLDLTLCFGAARHDGHWLAAAGHCWLARNGQPFLEARDPRLNFIPIYWLPALPHGTTGARA